MLPFPKCPVCGGQVVEKEVEEILRGGNNMAIIKVSAEVCQHCGERLFTPDALELFDDIVKKLEHQDTHDFKPIGYAYLVPAA